MRGAGYGLTYVLTGGGHTEEVAELLLRVSLPFLSREGAGTNANICDASVSLKIDEVFCGKVSLTLLVCVSRSLVSEVTSRFISTRKTRTVHQQKQSRRRQEQMDAS